MNVNPLDLQVLFTKAVDHAANLGKESAVNEAAQFVQNEQQTQKSEEAPEVVQPRDDYAQEFTKVDEDGHQKQENEEQGKKHAKSKNPPSSTEYKKATLTEEGTGTIIDIID